MNKELREKILAYNRKAKEKADKADDLDVLVQAFAKLPPGQLKKVLSDDVMAVIEKHLNSTTN